MNKNIKNLTGQRFNRWLVLEFAGNNDRQDALWKCQCDCGNLKIVRGGTLREGRSVSCGCKKVEYLRKMATTHGHSRTRTYNSWHKMKDRCLNSKGDAYEYYGGRGIKICERYKNSFEAFYEDMGERPEEMTIDRIDNDKNYSCGKCEECLKNGWEFNCRWATHEIQMGNTRRNIIVTYKGLTMGLKAWSKYLNIPYQCLQRRLLNGLSIEDAFNQPLNDKMGKARLITFNGKTRRICEWAEELHISRHTLCSRIDNCGWSIEKAFTTPVKK